MKSRLLVPLVLVAAVAACDRKADQPPAPKTAEIASTVATAPIDERHDDLVAWRRAAASCSTSDHR